MKNARYGSLYDELRTRIVSVMVPDQKGKFGDMSPGL